VTATVSCGDCRVEAKMVNFRGGEAVLELRASGTDRYALALTASGKLEIRRYRSGGLTVLASGASGIADLSVFHSFGLSAQGTVLVTLDATVDGVPKLSATDTSSAALTAAGAAAIAPTFAGIDLDGIAHTCTAGMPPYPNLATAHTTTTSAMMPHPDKPDAWTPDQDT